MKSIGVRGAASALGVHENTIRRWESQGIISAMRLPGSNFRRFSAEEIEKIRQGMIQRRERDHSSDTVRDDAPVLRGSYDESLWES